MKSGTAGPAQQPEPSGRAGRTIRGPAFQPERPEGKASPWRAGRTHGEQARKFLPWSGTSGRAVGSGTAGRTPATDEASSSPDGQHPQHPGFEQPKRPTTRTANTCNIRVLHNNSARQLKLSALETPHPSNAPETGPPRHVHGQAPRPARSTLPQRAA